MKNEQLNEYIQKARQSGQSDERIKKELLKTGWQEERYMDAFGSTVKPVQNKSKNKLPIRKIGLIALGILVVGGVGYARYYYFASNGSLSVIDWAPESATDHMTTIRQECAKGGASATWQTGIESVPNLAFKFERMELVNEFMYQECQKQGPPCRSDFDAYPSIYALAEPTMNDVYISIPYKYVFKDDIITPIKMQPHEYGLDYVFTLKGVASDYYKAGNRSELIPGYVFESDDGSAQITIKEVTYQPVGNFEISMFHIIGDDDKSYRFVQNGHLVYMADFSNLNKRLDTIIHISAHKNKSGGVAYHAQRKELLRSLAYLPRIENVIFDYLVNNRIFHDSVALREGIYGTVRDIYPILEKQSQREERGDVMGGGDHKLFIYNNQLLIPISGGEFYMIESIDLISLEQGVFCENITGFGDARHGSNPNCKLPKKAINAFQYLNEIKAECSEMGYRLNSDNKLSSYCTDPPTILDNGRTQYPIEPAYGHLPFLGQIFTADDCGQQRYEEIYGPLDPYTFGSTLWLKNSPDDQLQGLLEVLGYVCANEVSNDKCKQWKLTRDLDDADSLLFLKPYYQLFSQDDCINCG